MTDPYQLDKERRERLQQDRDLARDANIAANGRWGVLAMIAICIAADNLRMAVVWVLILFAAYFIEQFPHPDQRRVGALGLAICAFVLLLVTGATL